jgi:hypothetical protein
MRRAQGSIRVFTFKEGIFSRAAHDLQLRLEQFEISLDGETLGGTFDLKSLFVDGPVENGVVHPENYDASKRAEVEKAMHEQILHSDEYPTARYRGRAVPRGEGFSVSGALELRGRSEPLPFEVRREGGIYQAQIEILPSRWGLAQYKALLGAIRLKDKVRIDIALKEA